MNAPFSTELERLRYWQGQLLKSKDLRDQVAYNALLQAWHNRALHTPYGVRVGFQVLLEIDHAVILPGIAFDAYGRELVLTDAQRIPLPGQIPPGGLYLAARSQAAAEPGGQTGSDPSCWSGRGGAAGALAFSWEEPYRFDARQGVPLAHLLPGPVLDPHFAAPSARAEAQPRRFYSATLEGNTPWQIWKLPEPPAELSARKGREAGFVRFLGLEVEIDASAAGFTQTPCYFAWLSGDLWSPGLPGQLTAAFAKQYDNPAVRVAVGAAAIQILALRFGHITQTSSKGFVYRIWLPQAAKWFRDQSAFNIILALARQGHLTLSWLGIQMDQDIKENYGLTG